MGWNSRYLKFVYASHGHASSICFYLFFVFARSSFHFIDLRNCLTSVEAVLKNSTWMSACCKFKTILTLSGKCSSPPRQMMAVLGCSFIPSGLSLPAGFAVNTHITEGSWIYNSLSIHAGITTYMISYMCIRGGWHVFHMTAPRQHKCWVTYF